MTLNASYVNMKKLSTPNLRILHLAKNVYLVRHDKVCAHFNHSICKALGIKMADKWCMHAPTHTHTHTHTHTNQYLNMCYGIHRQRNYGKQARYKK